jgi:hypothetical protein
MASVAALMLIVGAGAALLPETLAATRAVASTLTRRAMEDVAPVAQRVEVTTNTVRVIWRALLEPLVAYASGLVVLMCLACAAVGVALNRVVFERA